MTLLKSKVTIVCLGLILAWQSWASGMAKSAIDISSVHFNETGNLVVTGALTSYSNSFVTVISIWAKLPSGSNLQLNCQNTSRNDGALPFTGAGQVQAFSATTSGMSQADIVAIGYSGFNILGMHATFDSFAQAGSYNAASFNTASLRTYGTFYPATEPVLQ